MTLKETLGIFGSQAQAVHDAVDGLTDAQYYRLDDRFSPSANACRIDLAVEHAGCFSGAVQQWAAFESLVEDVSARCAREPDDRVVRTRPGDAMLLRNFLGTRVVELTIHGLDIARAPGRIESGAVTRSSASRVQTPCP